MQYLFTYCNRLLTLLAMYTASRVYFYLNNSKTIDSLYFIEFLEGLRFDISALVYINLPLFVMLCLPHNLRTHNYYHKLTNWLFYGINIPFLLLNNMDIEYFRFTQKRSTIDFFQLLQLGEDAKSIIPQSIKDYWPITIFSIIQLYLLVKIKQLPKQKFALKIRSISKQLLILAFSISIFITAARGGLQLKPIKPINAGELSGSQNTALILNTPFCILHSLNEKPLATYNYFNKEKLNNLYSPIHLSINQKITTQNIVILIMESYSKEFVGFYNNGVGYTPFLDSLMQYSLVFTNAYANGLKSIEALPAITASIPALMNNPFITSNYAQNDFKSLASLLNQEGYNTSFYHGGIKGTMGFYSFNKKAGFTDYFGMEEYNYADDFDGSWGIYDGPFMHFFANGLNNKKEPFFSAFFSLSSHPPYTLPENYIKRLNKKNEAKKIGIRETILYSDYCMQKFFKKSKNQDWFKNTIFIITADHTSPENYNNKYKNRIGRYTIPLIIFSGDSSLQGIN
ncbi:MAG: LTA synthase family protein, partial [Bacteroidota bacterium]|nr:LTA synthase family protein [Bacteroidota bacterium]